MIMTSNEDFGKALDRIAAYIGMPHLETPQKVILIDFFKSEFKTIRADELLEAVKGAISGRIEPPKDISKIQRLSTGWFGSILQGYKKKRQELNARPEPVLPDHKGPILSQFTGVDGKERAYFERLEAWYLKHSNTLPPFGWAYGHARKYLHENGKLLVTAKDKDEVNRLALEHLRTLPAIFKGGKSVKRKVEQTHLDRAVMQLHLKRQTTIA